MATAAGATAAGATADDDQPLQQQLEASHAQPASLAVRTPRAGRPKAGGSGGAPPFFFFFLNLIPTAHLLFTMKEPYLYTKMVRLLQVPPGTRL